jgi:hypothetical protein
VPLSPGQARALVDDGYLLVPGLVPPALVEEALRLINSSLGSEGIAKDQLPDLRARTFTPELVRHEAIGALFSASPLQALAEAAIGAGLVRPPQEGQIALRFPTVAAAGPPVPHIDGIYSPRNGVTAGTLYHFTALAGVFLSDVPEANRGNFTVWPGSHRLMEAHLRAHGVASVMNGFPPLPLAPPRQITARAGDALLAHYQLAHGIAPNFGPHVRYAVFFRLFHRDHQADDVGPLHDLWREWEGVRAVVGGG